MARQKRKVKPLPTIWEVSDELWTIIKTILDEFAKLPEGVKPPEEINVGGSTK